MALEILTPLEKLHRVTRQIDPDTFVAVPGIWAVLLVDGSLENVTTDTPPVMTKLVISSVSDSIYESHDSEVGRTTTVEDIGTRVQVDTDGYAGTLTQGTLLAVSDKAATGEGKLFDVGSVPNGEAGVYEIVAQVEVVVGGLVTYRLLSPVAVTIP